MSSVSSGRSVRSSDRDRSGEFTEKLGLTLPVVEAAISQYRGYVDAGNGMQDSASVARLYVGDERQE